MLKRLSCQLENSLDLTDFGRLHLYIMAVCSCIISSVCVSDKFTARVYGEGPGVCVCVCGSGGA